MQVEGYEARERGGSDSRALTSIMGDLWDKTELLLRQELALVTAEVDEKVDRAKSDLITATISGGAIFLGAAALVAAVIGLLTLVMPFWASAGIVGIVLLVAGYALLHWSAKDLAEMDKAPRATQRSLERTAYQVKEAVR